MTDPNALVISQGVLMLFAGVVSALIGCIVFLHRGYIAAKDSQIAEWKGLFLTEQEINIGKDKILDSYRSSGMRALELARTVAVEQRGAG